MTWNYRIVRYHKRKNGFGLHEVHYDKECRPIAMTAKGATFHADADEGPAAIVKMLEVALKDAKERGVLDEPAEWSK